MEKQKTKKHGSTPLCSSSKLFYISEKYYHVLTLLSAPNNQNN
jgi:hypothetical protein